MNKPKIAKNLLSFFYQLIIYARVKDECWVMLIEKKATKHTGNVTSDITKSIKEQLK